MLPGALLDRFPSGAFLLMGSFHYHTLHSAVIRFSKIYPGLYTSRIVELEGILNTTKAQRTEIVRSPPVIVYSTVI